MDYSPRLSRSFIPRYYEMDDDGYVTPTTMMALFEECAAQHCEESGSGMFSLREEGLGWILIEGKFEMLHYPRNGETFSIYTWLEASRKFYGLRGFEVRDDRGKLMGSAQSLWVFYDIRNKHPAIVKQSILDSWRPNPTVRIVRLNYGGEAPALNEHALPYQVRSVDIDTNGHVNNVRYLEWALEAIPREIRDFRRLSYIEGRFIHEVKFGQRVKSVSEYCGEGSSPVEYGLAVYAINPADKSNRLSACARSRWILKR